LLNTAWQPKLPKSVILIEAKDLILLFEIIRPFHSLRDDPARNQKRPISWKTFVALY